MAHDRDVLCGRSLRLRHGWVGVVNRGQLDINKKMNMSEARAREAEFFRVRGWPQAWEGDLGGAPELLCRVGEAEASRCCPIRQQQAGAEWSTFSS